MIWRWVLAVLLLLLAAWFANLAMFNFWAGGGPPTAHPEIYTHRGYAYGAATIVCVIGFFVISVMNVMKRKR